MVDGPGLEMDVAGLVFLLSRRIVSEHEPQPDGPLNPPKDRPVLCGWPGRPQAVRDSSDDNTGEKSLSVHGPLPSTFAWSMSRYRNAVSPIAHESDRIIRSTVDRLAQKAPSGSSGSIRLPS